MKEEIKKIRNCILFFIISLFISGATAMPVETELNFLVNRFFSKRNTETGKWLQKVSTAVSDTNNKYPFIAYGYDWLAFAHFVLAILFIGPYKNPLKNIWVIEFGIIASVLIIPFAMIAGHFRRIPLGWRLIDCSFGVIALIPLIICRHKIRNLEIIQN